MRVLVINVGSSSIKYAGFADGERAFDSYVENIASLEGYDKAVDSMLADIGTRGFEPDVFAHRIVHGFGMTSTTRFTKTARVRIEKGCAAAPLHNTPQLRVLDALEKRKAKQVCVFDSLGYEFSDEASTMPIDRTIAKRHGLQRIGFHGISHTSIHEQTKHLGTCIITVHLGSGSSVTAWKKHHAVWNSLDFTPEGGVMMATRPGILDPGLAAYLYHEGMSVGDIEDMLTHGSGLKGIAGTKDLKTILDKREKGNRYDLAYRMLVSSIAENIARAATRIGGVDAIVFSGTIGVRAGVVRSAVVRKLSFLKPFEHTHVVTDEEQVIHDEAVRLLTS